MLGKSLIYLLTIETIFIYGKYIDDNSALLNDELDIESFSPVDESEIGFKNETLNSAHSGINKYSIEELMYTSFPKKISDDIYTDPCKAEFFIGDVAFLNKEMDSELRKQKIKMKLKDEALKKTALDKKSHKKSIQAGLYNQRRHSAKNNSDKIYNKSYEFKRDKKFSERRRRGRNKKGVHKRRHRKQKNKNKSHNKVKKANKLGKYAFNKSIYHSTNLEIKKYNESFFYPHETISISSSKSPQISVTPSYEYDVNDNFLTGMYNRKRKIRHKSKGKKRSKKYRRRHHKSIPRHSSERYKKLKLQSRGKRAATARKERVWDYGVIPYEIDANFTGADKGLFKQAMRHWENYTCVKFVEKTQEHENYIIFTERDCGCCSFVGKRGNGPQALSIGKNCDKFGIVVHELGHVVGFWHEHTRPDRDENVVIIRENIQEGQDYNFNKLTSAEVNSLGQPYDYNSIMHYARATFARATYLDTILPRGEPGQTDLPEIGQRVKLSDGDIAQTNLLYKCPKCGRTFQENAASFKSPSNKNTVAPSGSEECEWRITATHGERIVLNITSLDIHKSEGCKTDYLEIRDGYWYKSPSLGRFCGTLNVPYMVRTSGSRMLVTYVTSNQNHDRKGFIANYEAVCGGTLEMEEGILESPNYPNDYRPNKECVWLITVPENYQVAIRFHSFEIEKHDNCVYDFLNIRDGHEENSTLIGVYCGYKIPDDIKSTGNKMRIKFVTDGSVQKAGFSATFMKEYDECQTLDHGCEHECINQLGGYECQCKIGFELHSDGKRCEDACGGFINATNGTITSPSFPELYPANKNCIWEIIAPPQYRITLNFTHFDLEGNNQDCEYDSLDIQSKMDETEMRRHGVFCGQRLPSLLTSEGNSLRIEFNSDNSVQKSGFAAVFFTDKDECAIDSGGCQHICKNTIGSYACSCHNGYTLHENGHDCKEGGCKHEISSPVGEIFSPNYPDYYPSRKDCVWQFSTTPGHRIKLVFDEFEMEPHQECTYDHIVLYDGDSHDDPVLGRYCGAKIPHPIVASSSHMYMVFKSDSSVQRKGFRARHTTVCGGHLQAVGTVRQMYSHAKFGDQNYDNKEECDWVIEAPPLHRVHFTFLTFEVEDEHDCGYDFVEIFSGYDDTSYSFGKFCGSRIPAEVKSVGEALLVRFASDDTINTKGFSAAYVAIRDEVFNNDVEETYSYSFSRGYI